LGLPPSAEALQVRPIAHKQVDLTTESLRLLVLSAWELRFEYTGAIAPRRQQRGVPFSVSLIVSDRGWDWWRFISIYRNV